MKQNPAEAALRERMAPGSISRDGFLGTDDRPIADIISADMDALADAGVAPEALAGLLEDIHAAADANQEAPLTLYDGKLTAQVMEVRGKIPCPFADGYLAHKAVIDLSAEDWRMRVTPLGIHMLHEHGFLQGKGSDFRLEPDQLLHLWDLARESTHPPGDSSE